MFIISSKNASANPTLTPASASVALNNQSITSSASRGQLKFSNVQSNATVVRRNQASGSAAIIPACVGPTSPYAGKMQEVEWIDWMKLNRWGWSAIGKHGSKVLQVQTHKCKFSMQPWTRVQVQHSMFRAMQLKSEASWMNRLKWKDGVQACRKRSAK